MDNKTLYEKYDWGQLQQSAMEEKTSKILDSIPKNVKSIIDIGCGNGVITNALAEKYEVTGVDRSENALKYVKTKKIQADADSIPMPDGSFDLVLSSELLEHLEDQTFENTIKEFKRLTRNYIFITVPNCENPDKLSVRCPECKYIYNRSNHLRSFKPKDFKSLFAEYDIIAITKYGKKVRFYNPAILYWKQKLTPSSAWIPYYWIQKGKRNSVCPKCEHEFVYHYKFNILATYFDIINVIISPKRPYWLSVLMQKK
jgi:ubiquinone/menaquinone biosynthesis C-methylase UbiE